MHLTRNGRRLSAASIAVAVVATLLSGVPGAVAAPPKPPPPPTVKQQITQAQVGLSAAAKTAKATEVGQLNGEIAAAQAQLQSDLAAQDLAEQKVALAVSELQQAQHKEQASLAAVRSAQRSVATAHLRFVQYIQASYMGGDVRGAGGTMLTAADPTSLLDENALAQYQSRSKADAIGGMEQATVQQSNAEAMARRAVQITKRAKKAADAAKNAADQEVAAGEARQADLQAAIEQKQQELAVAQQQYATILEGRHEYVAYQQAVAERNRAIVVYNAYLAAERARKAAIARAKAVAAAEARAQAIAFAKAKAMARAYAAKHHTKYKAPKKSTSSSGGSQTFTSSGGSAPSGGGWTAAKGEQAARRAKSLLGERYIWAGGNRYGPTDGGCTDPIAPCGVVGYDCSGLVLYAWGRDWAHYAATQYDVGSVHPSSGNFKPGDLLFWSENGSQSGIGHVAVYIGNGNVVQAPQSGDVVKITKWYAVESGYYGATRPLT